MGLDLTILVVMVRSGISMKVLVEVRVGVRKKNLILGLGIVQDVFLPIGAV